MQLLKESEQIHDYKQVNDVKTITGLNGFIARLIFREKDIK